MSRIRDQRIINEVCLYIENHLSDPLTVDDLAKQFGFCNMQLVRIFKTSMKMNPSYYIRYQKIEKAKQWLLHSEMSVTEIADRLGYGYCSHFSRMFKSMVGMSPLEFRKRS